MATYYRSFAKYVVSGLTVGSGALIFYYNVNHGEKNKVFAAQASHSFNPKWDSNWDRRDPGNLIQEKGFKETDKDYKDELERHIPKATRHVFLIRHGQYNTKGHSDKDRYLTELGRAQAEYTGNRLKALNHPYTGLYRSTMTRAQETAEIILECLRDVQLSFIHNCNMLEEGAPIPPEPPVKHWKPEKYQFYQDGPRIEAAFRKYIHRAEVSQIEDSYDIIVCHANVIRYFVCRALQFPPEAWLRITLHHSSITWLVITPHGRVIVRCLGDSGHIPPAAITSDAGNQYYFALSLHIAALLMIRNESHQLLNSGKSVEDLGTQLEIRQELVVLDPPMP